MANEFKVRKGLIVQGSGSNIFDVQGSQGQLFSITDSLSGSLFSVNDISGIPIMEVFSDNTIKLGTFNNEAIIISGSRTGMGIATPQAKLHISGATSQQLLEIDAGGSATPVFVVSGSGNVGIGIATPQAKLHISGANNDSLFRIQSPASASIIFVSGSGNVGIGTTTPTQKISVDNGNVGFNSGFGISWDSDTEWIKRAAAGDQLQLATQNTVRLNIGSTQGQLVAIGLGTNAASAQFQVRGGGATAATTAMRIEDSGGNARLTILDDGTSAFNTNHLYVSSSGNIGIGTTTPAARLQIAGTPNDGISLDANNTSFNGINARLPGRIIVGASSTAYPKIMYNAIPSSSFSWSYSGNDTAWAINMGGSNRMSFEYVAPGTAGTSFNSWNTIMTLVSGSNNVGIGTGTPVHNLVVDGNTGISINAGGTTFPNIHRDSTDGGMLLRSWNGSTFTNNVKITPTTEVGIGTTSPTAELHISGANADALLRVGSPTNANILLVSGSGNVGIGTTTPSTTLQVAGTSSLRNIIFDTDNAYDIGTSAVRARNIWSNGLVIGIISYFNSAVMYNSARIGGEHTATALLHISGSDSAQMMRINSPTNANILFVSGSGNIGVGTTTPGVTLDVVGNIRASSTMFNSVTQTNNIQLSSAFLRFLSASVETARYDNNGWGFFNTAPTAKVHISGANADNLFRVSSPSATNALFVSGSGRIGIGTTTPAQPVEIVNASTPQLRIRDGVSGGNLDLRSSGDGEVRIQYGGNGYIAAEGSALRVLAQGAVGLSLETDATTKPVEIKPNGTTRLIVSASGNVGIGTTTPTTTLNVNGTTLLQGGQTTVRGSGATSATTAFRVENSNQDPELTVLDNGNVGISTATPSDLLTINSPSSTGSLRLTHLTEIETLRATSFHSGLYIGNNIYYNGSGDPATNSLYALDSGSTNRGGNLLLIRANNGTTSIGGFYFYTAPSSSIANTTATLTENLRILPSASVFSNTRVGIGATPNTSYAFDIQSSAPNAGAARINGNNTVWLFNDVAQVSRGTTSINRMVQMNMGPVNASSGVQSLLVLSQSINQSSTAGYTTLVVNANETGTGSGNKLLQAWQFNGTDRTVINNSGSLGIGIATPSASLHISGANNANLLRVSSPSASSALFISGSGNVGVGTATPAGLIDIFQGGNSRILVTTDNGFVGLQQSFPTEQIHITSDPVNGKYLQIDAGQTSNAPRQVVDSPATAIIGYAAGDSTVYLSEPRWWMEIKLDGNIVLIPCYQPDV